MFNMQEIGNRIAEARRAMGMTQPDLAEKMGVSFQAVSNWERGESMPDISKLPDLSQALHLSLDALLCGAAEKIVNETAPEEHFEPVQEDIPASPFPAAPELSDLAALAEHMDSDDLADLIKILLDQGKMDVSDLSMFRDYLCDDDLADFIKILLDQGKLDIQELALFRDYLDSDDLSDILKALLDKR